MKKGFFGEFREFIMRGNVMDMAVGVIMAIVFGKITASLIDNIFMPLIGWLIGDINLSKLTIALSPTVSLEVGIFISAIIDFILIAFIIFLVVKGINKMKAMTEKKKAEEEITSSQTTEELLSQILEEIKKGKG